MCEEFDIGVRQGLADQLGPDRPIAAFESPGLDGREPPLSSIDAIAARYVAELLPTAPSRFHVLGICWGAAVAFEMAKQLTAHGRQPASIILMDPAVLMRGPAAQPPRFGALEFVQGRLALYLDEFRKSDWRDRGLMIARKATRTMELLSGGDERAKTRTELSRDRVLNANLAAIANYRPERYHGSARIFITAERDLEGRSDWRFEWASLFTPQPDVVTIGGVDTGGALSSAHVHGFARAVSAWLDAAESQRSAHSST